MRPQSSGRIPGTRGNALWGSGRGNDARSSALWGKGGRGFVALLALTITLCLPVSGVAGALLAKSNNNTAVVPAALIAQATANPTKVFHVIVQGTKGNKSETVASDVSTQNGKLKHKFVSISGVAADLTGKDLLKLARHPHVLSITLDAPIASQDYVPNSQMWPGSTNLAPLWGQSGVTCAVNPLTGLQLNPFCVPVPEVLAPQAPAIAIVDSGIDASKVGDFGTRVVASVNLSSFDPNATGDQEGHGTMVAGIAAGSSAAYPGAAQNAPLVDVRTANANGESVTSDVIAAADWILAHKDEYNIKVANFSMAGATPTTFRFDPLDKAVESLWFNGIVVVAAAGNHGTGNGPVDMSFAPGNDPFVISVGALDQQETSDPSDDTVPSWSAYGYTMDGFSKPDLAAPGRYLVAPVPMDSTIVNTVPDRVVAPGYVWMSGTSFSAPVVAGAAAQILAVHPDWTPDEVKGALMLTSAYLGNGDWQSAGVGEIDAATAASLDFTPPSPNENLSSFVGPDATTGGLVFDEAAWSSAVQSDAAWSSAAWSSAAWSSAAWSSASWSSASWSSSSFTADTTAAMQDLASWSSAAWSSSNWSSASLVR
jgi:serine protease AprX